jgi:hypothetical protein
VGVASSRTPRPAQARLKSLMTHSVFGVGLYLSALCVSYVVPRQHDRPSAQGFEVDRGSSLGET